MSRRFSVCLVLFSVFVPLLTHAQSRPTSRVARDTLPAHVVRRSFDAYNRHDVDALASYYSTPTTHEMLGDSAARFTGTPEQISASLRDYFAKNKVHAELKQQLVSGPLVVLLYDFIENGKRTSHIEIYEVRHGKIVHDWDQGP